ncbi:hypothetical protein [Parvularcula maris]|uniref:Secreted protein n=1 Tax=Parvularcula maris TaxID=2965077 RepID=A0A9X2L6Y1_9PROT|nr:hypothetical protein [Parvularcula maris]MCQ8184074.1 hypothetical protein [Parvularcula maris]
MKKPLSTKSPVRGGLPFLSILFAASLAACTTPTGGRDTGAGRADPLGELIGREAGTNEEAPAPAALGPAAETFIGAPVGTLEAALGSPALTRREGANEFRRYDLEDCRVYAVVAPAGGNVQTVSAGPLVAGKAAPDFRVCTAGR